MKTTWLRRFILSLLMFAIPVVGIAKVAAFELREPCLMHHKMQMLGDLDVLESCCCCDDDLVDEMPSDHVHDSSEDLHHLSNPNHQNHADDLNHPNHANSACSQSDCKLHCSLNFTLPALAKRFFPVRSELCVVEVQHMIEKRPNLIWRPPAFFFA